MPALVVAAAMLAAPAGATEQAASPLSDAPDSRPRLAAPTIDAADYAQALQRWRRAEDINGWIGARFEYDMSRAMRLSETQRNGSGARLAIMPPAEFFAAPRGVCVDLARFGVETLRALEPLTEPRYWMIEFAPVTIAGNTLRLHWVAAYRRDGAYYVYADSKRPGHIAGPYASLAEFAADYARYRGREIVRTRELETYERRQRTAAARQERPAATPSP